MKKYGEKIREKIRGKSTEMKSKGKIHVTSGGRLGRDRMVVGLQLPVQSAPITTKVVRSTPVHGDVYSIKHYVIKFVSDL